LLAIGLCSFPSALSDAEDALARHVLAKVPSGDVRGALAEFVKFSEGHGLGMHLGEEKGRMLEVAVRQGLPPEGPATVFEAGCHAGDGTLSAVSAVRERAGSVVVSTEGNARWLDAAKQVVGHATKGTDVKFLPLAFHESEDLDTFLDGLQEKHGISKFDAVIFDHDEKYFLTHLKVIVSRGFLRAGGTVYVDNVKRKAKQLRKFVEYVSTKSGHGFRTEIKTVSQPYPDAVAISVFEGPPSEL